MLETGATRKDFTMHIDKATRAELEAEIIANDSLADYLGGLDAVQGMSTEELKDKITEWIIEGNEANCF